MQIILRALAGVFLLALAVGALIALIREFLRAFRGYPELDRKRVARISGRVLAYSAVMSSGSLTAAALLGGSHVRATDFVFVAFLGLAVGLIVTPGFWLHVWWHQRQAKVVERFAVWVARRVWKQMSGGRNRE